jgi:hypothetical protein
MKDQDKNPEVFTEQDTMEVCKSTKTRSIEQKTVLIAEA